MMREKVPFCFPLYPHEDRLHLAFMRRAEDGRVHGGQVSLPGGRHEPEDPDFTFTALRETEEEIGISPSEIDVLGAFIPPFTFRQAIFWSIQV